MVLEEEARQAKRGDHPQLLFQPLARLPAVTIAGPVADVEHAAAGLAQLAIGFDVAFSAGSDSRGPA